MSPNALTDYGISEEEHSEYRRPVVLRARAGTIRAIPKWLNKLLNDLAILLRLPPDWDHYGAREIDPQAALMTARFLCSVLREDAVLPKLVPTVRGNIQLEWYNDKAELEIEVGAQGPMTACFVDRGSKEDWEREITADLATIVDKINACF
jgi:hypothetical protein